MFVRVTDIDFDKTPKSTFRITTGPKAGKDVTYIEYYKDMYNLEIKNYN